MGRGKNQKIEETVRLHNLGYSASEIATKLNEEKQKIWFWISYLKRKLKLQELQELYASLGYRKVSYESLVTKAKKIAKRQTKDLCEKDKDAKKYFAEIWLAKTIFLLDEAEKKGEI